MQKQQLCLTVALLLFQGEQQIMKRGQVGYINDEIAVHRIRPNNDSALVSMYALNCSVHVLTWISHLYSPPIHRCQIYCPQLEKISEAKMCVLLRGSYYCYCCISYRSLGATIL